MNRDGFGVELIVDEKIFPCPSCPHGPMLLFERYTANGKNNGRRFFACSANRSRKLCKYFYWADEITNASNKECLFESTRADKSVHRLGRDIKSLAKTEQSLTFCKTCSLLLLPKESNAHETHDIQINIPDDKLSRPTTLLAPLEDSRHLAQYLFSHQTVSFILKTLKNLSISSVLCIGAPRIHEELILTGSSSLLMDIDDRYAQFYEPEQYIKYNMFNHHFFHSDIAQCQDILSQDSVCLLLDPPFGGLIDAIADTIKQIMDFRRKLRPAANYKQPLVLWFFPYFNEKRIVQACPSMKMLDFKIDYENHQCFNGKSGSSRSGSPIRIFTNFNPKLFKPPDRQNYRFCDICQKYVAKENFHCEKCQACTSKDGRPYKHCNDCQRCVKVSWHHCTTCQLCVVQDHKCCNVPSPRACHVCGRIGHKRKHCPSRSGKKRKKQ